MADELLRFGITVDGQQATVEIRRFLQEVSRIAAASGQAARGVKGLDSSTDSLDAGIKELERSLNETEKELGQVERQTKKLTEANRSGLSFIDKLSIRVTGLNQAYSILDRTVGRVVRAGFGFASQVVQTSASFEAYQTRLRGITGSAEAATRAFEAMKRVNQETPFRLGDVVSAGITIRAFGDANEAALQDVANLAAFMGTDVVTAAQAYGRAFAAGAGAADILRERGVLTKVSLVALKQGIDDITKVSLPKFRQLLSEALRTPEFANQATELSRTFNGIISNIQASLENLAADIGNAGFFDEVKKQAQSFYDLLQEMDRNGQLDNLAHQISDTLTAALRQAVEVAKGISPQDIADAAVAAGKLAVQMEALTISGIKFFSSIPPDVLKVLAGAGAGALIGQPLLGAGLAAGVTLAKEGASVGRAGGLGLGIPEVQARLAAERNGQSIEQSFLSEEQIKALDTALSNLADQSILTDGQLADLDASLSKVGDTSDTTAGQVKKIAGAFVGPPDSLFESAKKAEEKLAGLQRSVGDDLAALSDPAAKVKAHFRDMREEIEKLGREAGQDVRPLLSQVDTLEERTLASQQNMKAGFVDLFDVATGAFSTFLDAVARGTASFDQFGESIKASLTKAFVDAFAAGFKEKLGFEGKFKVNLVGFLADVGRIIGGGQVGGQGGLGGIGQSVLGNLLGGRTGIFGQALSGLGLFGGTAAAGGVGTTFATTGGIITLGANGAATFTAIPGGFVGPLLPGGVVSTGAGAAGAGAAGGGAAGAGVSLGAAAIGGGIAAGIIAAIVNSINFSNALNGQGQFRFNTFNRATFGATPPLVSGPLLLSQGNTKAGVVTLLDPFGSNIDQITGSNLLGLKEDPNEAALRFIAEFLANRRIRGAARFNEIAQGITRGGRANFRGLDEQQIAFGAIVAGTSGTGKSPVFAGQVGQAARQAGLDVDKAARAIAGVGQAMRQINQVFDSGRIYVETYSKAVQGLIEIFADLPADLAGRVRDEFLKTGGTATAREVKQFIKRDVKPAAEATIQAAQQSQTIQDFADALVKPLLQRVQSAIATAIVDQTGPVLSVPFFDIRQGFAQAAKRNSPGGRIVTPEEIQSIIQQTSEDLGTAFEDLKAGAELLATANRAGLIFTAQLQLASGDFAGAVDSVDAFLARFTQVIQGLQDLETSIETRIGVLVSGNDPLFGAAVNYLQAVRNEARTNQRIATELGTPAGTNPLDIFQTFAATPQSVFDYIRYFGGPGPGTPADFVGAYNFSGLSPERQLALAQEYADVHLSTLEAEVNLARQAQAFWSRVGETFNGLAEQIDILRRGPRGSVARTKYESQLAELTPDLISKALSGDTTSVARIAELAPSLLDLGAQIFGQSSPQFVALLDLLEPVVNQLGATALDEAAKAKDREDAAVANAQAFKDEFEPFLTTLETQAQEHLTTEIAKIAALLDVGSPILQILGQVAAGVGASQEEIDKILHPEGKAVGGPVYRGGRFLVGETGPELFVPQQSGTIVPLSASTTASAGTIMVSIPITVEGAASAAQVADQVAEALRIQHPRLVDELRRQGLR